LTVRLVHGRQPRRIVLDASLRVSETAQVYSDRFCGNTVVIVNERTRQEKHPKADLLTSRGITLVPIAAAGEQLDLSTVLEELGRRGINSILVEPGPTLATTIFARSLFDELVLFYAPTVLGDDARSAFGELHLRSLTASQHLSLVRSERVEGSDDLYLQLRRNSSL
jgi:diaminohydroxyphosphoribosylaminopyrimidine deaminase / 5-amino-6-(5-phosphoribosylamino)uracil reductase